MPKEEKEYPQLQPLIEEYTHVYTALRERMPKADPEAISRLVIAIITHSRLWKK